MRFPSRLWFAIIGVAALTLVTYSVAQGQAGWTNRGNIDHTNITQNVAGDIHVEGKIDGGSIVTLTSTAGSITIDGKIDSGSQVRLNAAGDIRIGQVGLPGDKKIDGGSIVLAIAGGQITLGNKIDGGSRVSMRAKNGISIGDKIDGSSVVKLCTTTGKIRIQGKIDQVLTEVDYWPSGSLIVGGGIQRGTVRANQQIACNWK
jgi:hypothetical protein